MAKLLKNELVAEASEDGTVTVTRTIQDVHEGPAFLEAVANQENQLNFMKGFIAKFDEVQKTEITAIRQKNRGKPEAEITSLIEAHKLYMSNQKQLFEGKQIPSIEKELPILKKAAEELETLKK